VPSSTVEDPGNIRGLIDQLWSEENSGKGFPAYKSAAKHHDPSKSEQWKRADSLRSIECKLVVGNLGNGACVIGDTAERVCGAVGGIV